MLFNHLDIICFKKFFLTIEKGEDTISKGGLMKTITHRNLIATVDINEC